MGVIAFGIANIIFILLPWLDRSKVVAPAHKRPAFMIWFWLLVIDMIILTIWGKLPPTGINAYIGFVVTIIFFLLLFVVLPIITKLEDKKNS